MSKYNKNALKAEYMAGRMSDQEFAAEKKLPKSYCYKIMSGWAQEREELWQRALTKTEKGAEKEIAQSWVRSRQANARLAAIINKKLDKCFDKDTGEYVKDLSAADVRSLAAAVKDLLSNESFAGGGPTERIDSRNINLDMVNLIEKIDRGETLE